MIIVNLGLLLAIMGFVALCWWFYQDPRYAIQDPFTLWGFAVCGGLIILLALLKIIW